MDSASKILVVEDNDEMRELVLRLLKGEGYRVASARDGQEMERALRDEKIGLVLLDVMLPDRDGLKLCRDLRSHSSIPVIILSAKGDEIDRVVGLKMGADDYLAKPFSSPELLARIESVLRRTSGATPENANGNEAGAKYAFDRWELAVRTRELVTHEDVVVSLSTGEFDLLLAMVKRPNRVLSRDQLIDLARSRDAIPFDRSIDTQISRLRRKLERDPRNPEIVKTVWGAGYIFAAEVIPG